MFKFRKSAESPKPPTRREALELRPLRNPDLDWYEEEGVVVLQIAQKAQSRRAKLAKVLNLFIPLPEEGAVRSITLDAIGSDVWRMCDGQTSLRSVARKLADTYQLTPREAEISVGQFFKDLGRRGFILLLTPEPKPAKAPKPKPVTPPPPTKPTPAATKSAPSTSKPTKKRKKR